MITRMLHTPAAGKLSQWILALICLASLALLVKDWQDNHALEQTLERTLVGSTVQPAHSAQERTRTSRHMPDLLPQLNRLARALDARTYVVRVQLSDNGATTLQVQVANLADAFAFADRLRHLSLPAVINQAQQTDDATGVRVTVTLAGNQ